MKKKKNKCKSEKHRASQSGNVDNENQTFIRYHRRHINVCLVEIVCLLSIVKVEGMQLSFN